MSTCAFYATDGNGCIGAGSHNMWLLYVMCYLSKKTRTGNKYRDREQLYEAQGLRVLTFKY